MRLDVHHRWSPTCQSVVGYELESTEKAVGGRLPPQMDCNRRVQCDTERFQFVEKSFAGTQVTDLQRFDDMNRSIDHAVIHLKSILHPAV